ncbi:hypothetical protein C8F01DRAFT_453355 [Mycena amicta]|nr:hypothetical protein C8F01DRAFT_453355 [Mycena amicta]
MRRGCERLTLALAMTCLSLAMAIFITFFLPLALADSQWDVPNLANPSAASKYNNATGVNLHNNNTMSFALSLSSTLAPLLALNSRAEEECVVPGDIPCALEEACCPPDATCQPTFCCPDIAQTCGNPTEICCEPGGPCCTRSPTGCCAPGAKCCNAQYPTGCCPSGTNCHVLGCCPTTAQKCNGATCCDSSAVCCPGSLTGCCAPGAVCCGGECCAPGSTCNDGICGAANPKLTFPYLKGHNDELIENICKGMSGSNTDTLAYSGSLDKSVKAAKRAAQGCIDGFCNTATTGLSCDEYPFASSDEGGGTRSTGVVLCVPEQQNNWQGQLMRGWVNSLKKTGFAKGSKFDVEVTGIDCSQFKRKRATITTTGHGGMLWPPLSFDSANQSFVMVSLGDIPAGSYSLNVNLTSGAVAAAYLVDNEGEELVNVTTLPRAGSPMQLSFDLDYAGVGVGLALFTNNTATNVSYTVAATPSESATSASASSTSTAKSGGAASALARSGTRSGWVFMFASVAVVAVGYGL